jgi:hypothetical protein
MRKYIHLAARAARTPAPIPTFEIAAWLWPKLREAFPSALGAVLMPDHLHLVVPGADPVAARVALARVLGNCGRARGLVSKVAWVPSESPTMFGGVEKLARNLRYVALNPVRAGLVEDPLAWPWSTHRDLHGAVTDPWVTPSRLGAALGWSPSRVSRRWHAYVSLDGGRPASPAPVAFEPRPGRPTGEPPLAWIAAAAASATRSQVTHIRARGRTRALFLALARSTGWWPAVVAERCGVTTRAAQRAWRRRPPPSLAPGLLCLGDARLRRPSE